MATCSAPAQYSRSGPTTWNVTLGPLMCPVMKLSAAPRNSQCDRYGTSTILPCAPGLSTASCAAGASASGISTPTSGR